MSSLLGRSKSLRLRNQKADSPKDYIGVPQLIGTDAEPRDDLRQLHPVAPWAIERQDLVDIPRPRTAGGTTEQRGRTVPFSQPLPTPDTGKLTTASPQFVYSAQVYADMPIGTALGSPTHTPSPEFFSREPQHDLRPPNRDATVQRLSPSMLSADSTKAKGSRWKNLFKKPSASPSASPYPQPSPGPKTSKLPSPDLNEKALPQLRRSRSHTGLRPAKQDSPKLPEMNERILRNLTDQRAAPPVKRAVRHDSPIEQNEPAKHFPSPVDERPIPLLAPRVAPTKPTEWPMLLADNMSSASRQSSKSSKSSKSSLGMRRKHGKAEPERLPEVKLDLDLPDIKMDRYSVMFSSVLNPGMQPPPPPQQQPQQQHQPGSSLLARRGTNERITPLKGKALKSSPPKQEHLRPPRSYTEPSPTRSSTPTGRSTPSKSPKFSLFPTPNRMMNPLRQNPPSAASVTNRARPLKRSHTAPTASPVRDAFHDTPKPQQITMHSTRGRGENIAVMTPITPSTAAWSDDDDLQGGDDVPDTAIRISRDESIWRPKLDEPDWEIVNPHKASSPRKTRSPPKRSATDPMSNPSSGHSKTPSLATMSSVSTDTSLDDDLENTEIIKVSLARSVSVGKANAPKLKIQSPPMVLEPKRYVAPQSKPSTPTLVEVNGRDRKSHQVKIETF